jgi:aspartyl-tRNA(Asn)/glutamyl-tRNA(Gln) amidotransferase subunit A
MITDDVLFSSLRSMGHAIRTRKLSPVELTETYLNRLETIGPKLAAVVTVTRELALKQAHAAENEIAAGKYRGPLHGIPYGAKDVFATRGIPTTWGAAPYRDRVLDFDATIITRLEAAGAVLLGKLALVELVGGLGYDGPDASFTGPARTPWNSEFWTGGSSSGPGAATAAGLVAFSIGSETGGSILGPSTNCGLAGLRPTYGRVSRHGAAALCWSLDKVGPMCRCADDCGLVLSAIAGYDKSDPTTSQRKFVYTQQPARRRYKVGIVKGSYDRVQPEIKSNFEKSVEVLSQFCDVQHDVEFPDYPYTPILWIILGSEGASAYRELVDSGKMRDLQNQGDRMGGYVGSMISAVDYLQAQRVRKKARLALDEQLTKYDALIAPSSGAGSRRISESFNRPANSSTAGPRSGGPQGPALIPAGNIAGLPGLTIPNGFGQNNIPSGLQFLSAAWSESTMLSLADAYQQRTDWHKQRPSMTGLTA